MLGHARRERAPHLVRRRRAARLRHHVADQLGTAGVGADRRGRRAHAGQLGQLPLDLADLDPEAPDLHLAVATAEVVQPAPGDPAGQVTGAVHPRADRAEGVRDEPLGGRPGVPQVAPRQVRPGQVELADGTVRHGLQGDVEHVDARAGQGVADRRGTRRDRGDRGVDGGLGRAVHVAGGDAGVGDALPQRGRGGLAAEDQQRRRVLAGEQARLHQLRGHRRRGVDDVDAVAGVRREQLLGVLGQLGVVEVQLVPAEQPEQLVDRGVERERVGVRHAQDAVGHPVGHLGGGLPVVRQQAGETPGPAEHALGTPGRAGRVDHVGEPVRGLVPPHERPRLLGVGLRTQVGDVHGAELVDSRVAPQDQRRAGVVDQLLPAPGRVGQVQGQVGRARVHHREERDDEVHAARERERDDVVGADAARPQGPRRPVHAVDELDGREPLRAADQGGAVAGLVAQTVQRRRDVVGVPGRRRPRPLPHQPVLLVGRDQVDAADRRRLRRRQRVDHPEQGVRAPLDAGLVGEPVVDLEAEADAAVRGRGGGQLEVLRRAARDVAHDAGRPGEVDRVVEGLEVDAADQHRAQPGHPELPREVGAPEALVGAHLLHEARDAAGEVVEAVVPAHGDPQRQQVDGHRRGAQRRLPDAAHQRHADDDVGLAVGAVQEGREAADEDVGPGRRGLVPDGAQPGEGVRRDHDRRGDRALRRPGRRARGTRRVGQRGEAVAPVGPVLLVALARPVLLVGRDEVGDRAELGRRALGAPHQRRVVRGRPPGHHRRGVPVDDHVVVELHPPHRAVGEPQQRLAVQPAVHQPAARLGRPRPDGRHGRVGRRDGVGLGAEVDDLGGLRGVVGQRLARAVRGVVEAQVQRLGLVDRGADGLREGREVERLRPVDLHDVADEVVRGVRLQPLRVPDPELGAGQLQQRVRRGPRPDSSTQPVLRLAGRPSSEPWTRCRLGMPNSPFRARPAQAARAVGAGHGRCRPHHVGRSPGWCGDGRLS